MCSFIISVVYIYVLSYLVWRGLLCFIIFLKHMECICRWKFISNKNQEKWSMPITKTQYVRLIWKDNQNVTFHELKSILKKGYNWLHICGAMLVFSVLVLREVRENSWNLSKFLLLLENRIIKIHAVFFIVLSMLLVSCGMWFTMPRNV